VPLRTLAPKTKYDAVAVAIADCKWNFLFLDLTRILSTVCEISFNKMIFSI
jgi:hypothetical protein